MKIKALLNPFLYFYCLLLMCTLFKLSAQEPAANPYVLVSVSPHKFFVEKIAGDTLKVGLMVPAGASAHTYEPTPKQMVNASSATLWFRIGEPFEERAIKALKSHNPALQIIDLRQDLDLINSCPHSCCHHANAMDLHFWLSARLAQTQAQTVAQALIKTYPEHATLYRSNLTSFLAELKNLDEDIQTTLSHMRNRNILVSHPAYAYFCRDYNLKQFSIEFEGKDPSPQQLNKVLNLARQLNIKTIFTQVQYSSKGARLIAYEIGAAVVDLDPYSENYIQSMRTIAQAFAEG